MTIGDNIIDETLKYDVNREAVQISALIKLINMIILQVKKYYDLIKVQ